MSIKIANLNVNDLSDRGKAARLLRDLLSFRVDTTATEETHIFFDKLMPLRCLAILLPIQHMGTDWPEVFSC